MRIAYIAAGAGGMYCGSCLHDNALASALLRLGEDVALTPIYTPMRTDVESVAGDRVFYGALNVYLEQKLPWFHGRSRWLDRLLTHPRLLSWVSSLGGSTDARELGDLTLSMLQGEEGRQREELAKLVEWLRDEFRPDVVHLTNSMLVGMARRLRRELDVPVLCSLQGEDIFLDDLPEPQRSRVAETLRERAADVDGFVAVSEYYAGHMRERLGIGPERMHVIPLGLGLDPHRDEPPEPPDAPFVVGYLARICPEKGLHHLVEAFGELSRRLGSERLRLHVAGYLGPRDRDYFEQVRDDVRAAGLSEVVRFFGEVDHSQKLEFLRGLHVLSVPTVYREPKGRFLLEAWASRVPVVQPAHGAFPELVEATGGGVLTEPGSVPALVDAIAELHADPERRRELGRSGREAVLGSFGDEPLARATLELYHRYVGGDARAARKANGPPVD